MNDDEFKEFMDSNSNYNIKKARIEDLKQNQHVQGLLDEIEFQSIRHDSQCSIAYENECDCFASRARAKLKEWE